MDTNYNKTLGRGVWQRLRERERERESVSIVILYLLNKSSVGGRLLRLIALIHFFSEQFLNKFYTYTEREREKVIVWK